MSKYFGGGQKKGEINELKEELDSQKEDKKKEAVKKVIAAMTVGKDVSMLFADVVKCMTTNNLELKKLVYLYIMNYAKSQPDLAILAVNTFVKDASSPNPLIRALAVRTMGCIRVNKITEYLCQPLHKSLKDPDPYVRKTAAVCVAKLYDINAELVRDQGFLETLKDLLSDSNPMVVANAVAALSEISEGSAEDVFEITSATVSKLLAALNECTEWGQVFILNSIAKHNPRDAREAENICERVTPRLQHANSAVVLGAVKVLMKFMPLIQSQDVEKSIQRKMAPPLVTLLSKEPEIQYVALRNINLIVQKRLTLLQHEMKVFFCKYNDPIYVKMEKLEIMIMLAQERNIDQVLLEFKEYATEVDVEFVRKSVRAIGRCAVKLERAAEKCVQVLLELIQTKVNYVVQEAIIVIKDIFRKYPNQYESIIATLCENLDTLDEPEAKASMIWIIGEYAERIDNADELLEQFLENFLDESQMVQLALLTACVKLFLKRPKDTQKIVQNVLRLATEESDNPDLRDRGFIYWRLLSTDPEAAKAVVLSEKPLISDETLHLDAQLLDSLLGHISTLASVYHKPPETFVSKLKKKVKAFRPEDKEEVEMIGAGEELLPSDTQPKSREAQLLDISDLLNALPPDNAHAAAHTQITSSPASDLDFLGMGSRAAPPPQQQQAPPPQQQLAPQPTMLVNRSGDLDFLSIQPQAPVSAPKKIMLPADRGKGMQIRGRFVRRSGTIFLDLTFENLSSGPLQGFAMQFNRNTFGLAPASAIGISVVMPGQSIDFNLPCGLHGPVQANPNTPTLIQVAVKNNVEIFYFQEAAPLYVFFSEDGLLEKAKYLELWRSIPDANERQKVIPGVACSDLDGLQRRLGAHNIFFVAKRRVNDKDLLYLSSKLVNGDIIFLIELTFSPNEVKSAVKTLSLEFVPAYEAAIEELLRGV